MTVTESPKTPPITTSRPSTEQVLGDLVLLKPAPFNAEAALHHLSAPITPTESFYVRSNFAVPAIDQAGFRLRVGGAVRQALELSLDDLRRLGTTTVSTVMECAGNNRLALSPLPSGEPWHAGAVSAGTWTGVPLRAVLEQADLREDVVEILAEGADHGKPKDGPGDIPFARSLPLEKALHPDTLLVLDMNGAPLPRDHGAPLRLIVPDWYGMASVKWVLRVEALTEPFTGYYQANRYIYAYGGGEEVTPVTTMRVKSIITAPLEGNTVPLGPFLVTGKAWSGEGEIVKVEVAVDGGDDWREARLLPADAEHSWRAWEFEWNVDAAGRRALRSRATDSTGNVQPHSGRWNKYGYGNNAVRTVIVNAV
ncbi:MAG TPA: sulfite oxidase [Chloroflexota bacterium]|nr:sulfite oxidase [Chloroflexota bacterium]